MHVRRGCSEGRRNRANLWRFTVRHTGVADLEVLDETAERVLGHSQGGLMATYNISRHRKQKTAALVALEAEILRLMREEPVGNIIKLSA